MKANILIADDDLDAAEPMAENLTAYGFSVRTAGSPKSCFTAIEADVPDLLILDIRFSPNGREGFDLCRRIKTCSNPEFRGILIVLMTAYHDIDCELGLEAGADAFIRSPVDFPALRAHIRTLLQARDSAYEIARLSAEKEVSAELEHNLRNVLQTPFLVVNALLQGEPSQKPYLSEPAKECVELANMLLQKLAARGRGEARLFSADPTEILLSCESVRKKICESHGVQLKVIRPATTMPPVKADPWEIVFCLAELIENALRAFRAQQDGGTGGDKPMIILSTHKISKARVAIKVVDNGPGVPEELKDKVFENRFTMRGQAGGTGQGLWLMRRRLSDCGASIHVEDNVPRGAVFVITLNMVVAQDDS